MKEARQKFTSTTKGMFREWRDKTAIRSEDSLGIILKKIASRILGLVLITILSPVIVLVFIIVLLAAL